MSASTFAMIAAAVGLPSLLGTIIKGVADWVKGRGEKDKVTYRESITWKTYSMEVWEAAWKTRRVAIKHKVPFDELPDIPEPPKEPWL